ncbi:hypothetical protein [Nannocystis pusilla]|uniref:hypothetical protein n=1 Tax=Nannocystis pusilla TaxID=889268 RepID=UPI003B7CDE56
MSKYVPAFGVVSLLKMISPVVLGPTPTGSMVNVRMVPVTLTCCRLSVRCDFNSPSSLMRSVTASTSSSMIFVAPVISKVAWPKGSGLERFANLGRLENA